jgi:hypothetical protein
LTALNDYLVYVISNCNEYGNFVLEYYYAGNACIPKEEEINEIIKIIRAGKEEDEFFENGFDN